MMWIMAALWLILIGILFFLIKKHRIILNKEKIKLNKKFQKEEERLVKNYEELEAKLAARAKGIQDNYAEKEKWLKWDLDKLKNDKETLDRHICELKDFGQRQVDEKIKDYEQLRLTQINHSLELEEKRKQELLQRQLDDFIASAAETKKSVNEEIEELRSLLEDYKSKRDLINEAIRKEQEVENFRDRHRIILTDIDKQDINFLLSISDKIRNKEILYKLIWSEYLQKPFNEMLNNIFGNSSPKNVIYCIENYHTHQKYIGKTSSEVKKRWTEHIKTSLNIGSISHTKIHKNLFNNWDNFTFDIIEITEKDELSKKEKYWINFYESDKYGYNIKSGG